MKENEDKLLQNLVETVMKTTLTESTSNGFSERVMSQILKSKKTEVYTYKPLISRAVIVIIVISYSLFVFYVMKKGESYSADGFSRLEYFQYKSDFTNSLFQFSKSTIFPVVFLALMLLILISFLKKHFDRHFE